MVPPPRDDDWSDSDDDDLSQVETSVLLGVPDGNVDEETDILDAAVSRIGGLPVRSLVAIRSWRGLRLNEKYAAKLAKKRQRQQERAKAKAEAEKERARLQAHKKKAGNPFTMNGSEVNSAPAFGFGAHIFGAPTSVTSDESPPVVKEEDVRERQAEDVNDSDSDSGSSDEESLLTAMAEATISESPWRSAPSYPPIYLSTVAEYLPPQPKPRLPQGIKVEDLQDDDRKEKDVSWAKETYEDSLEVDQVFERFMKRVGYEGEQCVRYELKGTPLPFASDKTFDLLWPMVKQDPLPVTKPDFKVVHNQRRVYDTSAVPRCPHCKGPRVFECQLMPNLINILRPSTSADNKKMTDEERRKAVQQALKNEDKLAKTGMDWGTAMIFSCENDCCQEDGKDLKDCWREEIVYIQWDV
ncbi:putative 20S rRNA accumulation protein 4 [Psilocybe cubensis]|uniref:20S rRNA accumulation protein 4 n=1 Tax=Psilocybe cubensis TaxID=181762 RepID=A0ACB8GV88_PSICU|nr:putative 20S rRNA accumulation protein 4 [Psilocybe cubensis]KAH9479635.1 putative 20S rRNA accumulation protein 4 [Psilocybe cubensis]